MRVLVVGGAGMLGRPVVRRLVRDGFTVRVLARDRQRAAALVPGSCEFAAGDLRDATALDAALRDVAAIYVNLNTPFSPRAAYDPDRDGTAAIIAAARRTGVRRLLRISALIVPAARRDWWAIERKAATDQLLIDSGLDYTIFRPDWFLESIPLFVRGPLLLRPGTPHVPLRWIAGDDYGREVAAALRSPAAIRRVYDVRGPEPLTFRDACGRFATAWHKPLLVLPLPRAMLRAGGLLRAAPAYLRDLLTCTFRYARPADDCPAYPELPPATMRVEDYVRYVAESGDFPRK